VVSTVYPFITATEFHSALRAGSGPAGAAGRPGRPGGSGPRAQRPEQVAEVILGLVRSGAERADLVPVEYGGSYEG
jgi:hypothetical protein